MAASSSWREPAPASTVREERCRSCRKLLGTGEIKAGQLRVVCPRCKTLNTLPRTR